MSVASSVRCLACVLVLAACGGGDDGGDRPGGGGGVAPPAGAGGAGASGGAGAGSGGMDEFDAGSEPDRNMVAAGELCDRLATIQCAAETHCCDSANREFAACKTEALGACNGTLALDTIAGDARVGFDAAAASTAFTAYEMRASTCDAGIAVWAASNAGFMSSFTGTVAAGGDCMAEGGLGASTAELFAALASCDRSANLACMPGMSAWTCTARAAAGGACMADFNCADGLYCEGAVLGDLTEGTCTAAKAAGMSCNSPTQCSSLVCLTAGMCAAAGDDQAVFCP